VAQLNPHAPFTQTGSPFAGAEHGVHDAPHAVGSPLPMHDPPHA
jgi:hypothetical protein